MYIAIRLRRATTLRTERMVFHFHKVLGLKKIKGIDFARRVQSNSLDGLVQKAEDREGRGDAVPHCSWLQGGSVHPDSSRWGWSAFLAPGVPMVFSTSA